MRFSIFLTTKSALLFSNIVLLITGIFLVLVGFVILIDWPRVLLSRLIVITPSHMNLPQPPLYYIALIILGFGLIICSAAILGCWSVCLLNYCVLSLAFLIIFILLLVECIIYGMVLLWPNCLGLNISPILLAKTLQRSYAKPGFEQYTAAVDLAQTKFKCCAISTSIEYDTSLWRLQSINSPKLAVPLTCCVLTNSDNLDVAYLEPNPIDLNKCQALELEFHNGFRHLQGCITKLEKWYNSQYRMFMIIGSTVALIEFLVLLVILLTCTKIQHYRRNNEFNINFNKNNKSCEIETVSQNTYDNPDRQIAQYKTFLRNKCQQQLNKNIRANNYRINP